MNERIEDGNYERNCESIYGENGKELVINCEVDRTNKNIFYEINWE